MQKENSALNCFFRVSVAELEGLFSLLVPDQIMGFVTDQSPYYPFITSAWGPPRKVCMDCVDKIKHDAQGVNAGLMLFKLAKMRESVEYNEELVPDKMSQLSERFLPQSDWSQAAQDWFSLLSWERPHLIDHLPCQYNVLQCSTVVVPFAEFYSNIPCGQETAIAHYCGMEMNV